MNVKEIIRTCKQILNAEYVIDDVVGDESYKTEIDFDLLRSVNYVLDELYSEHAVKIGRTVITAQNGLADVSPFGLDRVVSLTDGEGRTVPFRYTDNALFVERDGMYNLVYAKKAPKVTEDSDVELPSPRLSERIVVYGVLREYFLSIGDYTRAEVWDGKFKDSLRAADVKTCGRLPQRRWL